MRTKLVCLAAAMLCLCQLVRGEELFFVPPSGWMLTKTQSASPLITVTMRSPQKKHPPALTLAQERYTCSNEAYLRAAEAWLQPDTTRCLRVGTKKTKSGPAHILQLERETPHGIFTQLQAILFSKGTAYILSFAAPKADFIEHQNAFSSAIASMQLLSSTSELIDDNPAPYAEQKRRVQNSTPQSIHTLLPQVEAALCAGYPSIGRYGHFLLMKMLLQEREKGP